MSESNEIDIDEEYFQRTILRKSRNLAQQVVNRKYEGQDISEGALEGALMDEEQRIYDRMMKESALSAEIPIHTETNKTADTPAIRYKAKPGVTMKDYRNALDGKLDKFASIFEEKTILVKESRDAEGHGWFRNPTDAVNYLETLPDPAPNDYLEITPTLLAKIMDDNNMSVDILAGKLNKGVGTIQKWLENGVPKTAINDVNALFS